MVIANSYEWAFSYEELLKLRKMDPGQAELYKSRKLKQYNEARIGKAIQAAREYYAAHVSKDPNWQHKYAAELRDSILNIPGIDKSEEHKDLYNQCRSQVDKLNNIQISINETIGQPWMDDLWSDEPDIAPAPVKDTEEETVEDKVEETIEETVSEEQEEVKDTEEEPTTEEETEVAEEEPTTEEETVKKPKRKITFKNKK